MLAVYAGAWSNCFKNNKALVHVDISHSDLTWPQMEIIGGGLSYNHTILGIHVIGNDAEIDSMGFVRKLSKLQHLFQVKLQSLMNRKSEYS